MAGPFSVFDGIDRTMAILRGRLELAFDDRNVVLTADSAPFAFSGDVPCIGRPLSGRVTDLNVMTRRGRCSAMVSQVSDGDVPRNASLILATVPSKIRSGSQEVDLAPLDALLLGGGTEGRLIGAAYAVAIVRM
jgi:environmental stress-induced protein Ves